MAIILLTPGPAAGLLMPVRTACVARKPPRAGCVRCWTGESKATVVVTDIPLSTLYSVYRDVERMPEWSPLLESVTVDPDEPSHSLWVMKVPKPLVAITRSLGYTAGASSSAGRDKIAWEAVLDAPGTPHPSPRRAPHCASLGPVHLAGPPSMSWTSLMREAGGVQNAGFIPEGSVTFEQIGANETAMTLCLRYTLPEPAARWKITLVDNPFVQGIVRNRMVAGLERFARTVRRDLVHAAPVGAGATMGAATD